jgi:cytochrome c oxidase subunit 2
MAREERLWFGFLILVFVVFNAVTLSPIVPWQKWMVWSKPTPEMTIGVEMENYEIRLPKDGISVGANKYVEFVATSEDVTYGLGVFRPDGTLVFQMQVLPGRENRMLWKFDAAGTYDVRSTEYSGPRHSEMFIKDAVRVTP